ncbi:hypothetical protein BJF78_13370 [Pseudonocardia sp. CNS-139]|nr:hypothetical protein BJF78_13370 [Pseudonocardia sp. CNS-139]
MTPRDFSSVRVAVRRRTASAERLELGSSSRSTCGPWAPAAAIATCCCCPPERRCRGCWIGSTAASPATVPATRVRMSSRGKPKFSIAKATSSRAVSVKNCRRGCCSTVPVRRPISSSSAVAVGRPSTTTAPVRAPSSWKWGMSPFISRRAVDLPEPLAPHRTTNSPGATCRPRSRRLGASACG